jgi:hypothetical protein
VFDHKKIFLLKFNLCDFGKSLGIIGKKNFSVQSSMDWYYKLALANTSIQLCMTFVNMVREFVP